MLGTRRVRAHRPSSYSPGRPREPLPRSRACMPAGLPAAHQMRNRAYLMVPAQEIVTLVWWRPQMLMRTNVEKGDQIIGISAHALDMEMTSDGASHGRDASSSHRAEIHNCFAYHHLGHIFAMAYGPSSCAERWVWIRCSWRQTLEYLRFA